MSNLVRLHLLAGLVVALIGSSAMAADWPQWNGPNRDGRSPDTGLLKEWPAAGPKQLWKNEAIGQGFSGPIVVGDTLYILGDVGNDQVLFALDQNGKQKWKQVVTADFTADRPGERSTPTYDDGKLYVLGGLGDLLCLDAAQQGHRIWSKNLIKDFGGAMPHWGYAESPLVWQNLVIVTPGGRPAMVAVDKATGNKAWVANTVTADAHYCSAIAATQGDTPVIINGTGSGLIAVNARTGAKMWTDDFATKNVANCPSPVVVDGLCFWAVGYGVGGVCLKLNPGGTATRAWTTKDMVCHHGGYIVDNGYVFGNNGSGWTCLELKTGKTKWTDKGVGKGSICYADGMLYLFNESGQAGLAVCSPDKLQMKGTFKVAGRGDSWAHPVVIGGRLYLRYNSNLYCFDVSAK